MQTMKRYQRFSVCLCTFVCGLGLGLVLVGCAQESGPAEARNAPGGSSLLPASPVSGQQFTIVDLGLEMRPVPAGSFRMGSPLGEPGRNTAEGPQTWVTISRPYWLGRTTVTHRQWRVLMGTDLTMQAQKAFPRDKNPAGLLAGTDDDVAMYFVNWNEAIAFCEKLTARARAEGSLPSGYEFTLPTEAQWEYACRAGSVDATYAGPMLVMGINNAPVLDEIAWYAGNSSEGYQGRGWNTADWPGKQYPGGRAGVRRVGLKQPNAWGLCDMLGNVYQWCLDFPTDSLSRSSVTDPVGPASGSDRIVRGGSWHSAATYCRSSYRAWSIPDGRLPFIGFRVALAPVRAR